MRLPDKRPDGGGSTYTVGVPVGGGGGCQGDPRLIKRHPPGPRGRAEVDLARAPEEDQSGSPHLRRAAARALRA